MLLYQRQHRLVCMIFTLVLLLVIVVIIWSKRRRINQRFLMNGVDIVDVAKVYER
jgi:hypothetical protein